MLSPHFLITIPALAVPVALDAPGPDSNHKSRSSPHGQQMTHRHPDVFQIAEELFYLAPFIQPGLSLPVLFLLKPFG